MKLCPCKSRKTYNSCCYPFISKKQLLKTAEQLMRSRYSAFAIDDKQYLLDTWHKDFRPKSLQLNKSLKWPYLEIIKSEAKMVHFKAYSLFDDQLTLLEEKSNFIKVDEQWFYTDGEIIELKEYKVSRNSPCLCGSGKKFKRCCGIS